jgi:hypothetical protein
MGWFIFSIIIALVAVGAIIVGDRGMRIGGVVGLLLAVGVFLPSILYNQAEGQVTFVINPGGGLNRADDTAGAGTKAPWQRVDTWDLFSRDLKYTGGDPSYDNGEIGGPLIKAGVEGGTIATFSLTGTYDLKGADYERLYKEFRNQERFTRQVIEPLLLPVAKSVPGSYDAVSFRGNGIVSAANDILIQVNKDLEEYGVSFTVMAVGNPDFPDNVEAAIAAVEESEQKEAKAQNELAAATVEAQTQVEQARAAAEANRLLSESLTPEVLEYKRLETLERIGAAGNLVIVPEGSTPFVQVTK